MKPTRWPRAAVPLVAAVLVILTAPGGAAIIQPPPDLPLPESPVFQPPTFVMRCEGALAHVGLYSRLRAPDLPQSPGSPNGVHVYLFAGQEVVGYFAEDGAEFELEGRAVFPYVFVGGTNRGFAYCSGAPDCAGVDWIATAQRWIGHGVSGVSSIENPCGVVDDHAALQAVGGS